MGTGVSPERITTGIISLLRNSVMRFQYQTGTNGDGEIRTLDPLLARQVLSQLSYAPIVIKYNGKYLIKWA